ncbi:putative fatty acyl-CoA reductase, partial [Stegodyphus mimosarum]
MDTEMELEAYSELTPIQKFFFGRSVFITGATGLVGKVLVEKLLRCCPGIGKLYLLVRPKKGKTAEERIDALFKIELFSVLKKVFPKFQTKVRLVDGDLQKDRLGISDEDFEEIRANVSIAFHSAASVQFKDPLRLAVQSNMIATKMLVDLCHQLPHIAAAVHVSTSYIRREPDGYVLERVPVCKVPPKKILDAMEWMDENCINALTDYLLEGKLTTYLVTKALAEKIVEEERGDLPTAIVRPCNISPTYKDPFPGWVDSIQGLSGLLLAGAKGVLRTLPTVKGLKINVVPVDLVANTLIASAWHVATERPPYVYVVNCVLDYERLPVADEDILGVALKKRDEYPLVSIYRYPDFKIYYSYVAYKIHSIIDEWIPAIFLDFFLYIFTGKVILTKVYRKVAFLYGIFYKLGRVPWICKRENYLTLEKRLTGKDTEIFFLNLDDLNWMEYLDNCLKQGRKFIAHEDPSNIPYAKKKAKVWWLVTTTLKWCLILYFFYYLFCQFFLNNSHVKERMYTISP